MLVVAVLGLVVNLVSMKLLSAGSTESLNLKGAYFEVLSDMLGSLGVIVAAGVVMLRLEHWQTRSSAPASGYLSYRGLGYYLSRRSTSSWKARRPKSTSRSEAEALGNSRRNGRSRPACVDVTSGLDP